MTDVDFHFNAPDRLAYACRLLRKAMRKGSCVAVTGPAGTLDTVDRLLWTFEDTEFVPHLRLRRGAVAPPRLQRTPVWLVDEAAQAVHLPVLVNLGDEPVGGFETFARLIEIVDQDAPAREAARARWRHYQSRGYKLTGHEVSP
jgi:DNA polymerase III subunit chi